MIKDNSNTTGFFAKYKHPLWQKRRLEIMQSANFKCQECGDSESELNVHHKYYVKGRDIWDYSDAELSCLCRQCHDFIHADSSALDDAIRAYKREGSSLSYLAGFIDAHNGESNCWKKEIPSNVERAPYLEGFTFGMVFGLSEERIIDAIEITKADKHIDYFVFLAYFGGFKEVAKAILIKKDISHYPEYIAERIKSVASGDIKSYSENILKRLCGDDV